MKITLNQSRGSPKHGFVTVMLVLTILGVMVILVTANTSNLNWLHKEVRLVEKRQVARDGQAATNTLAGSTPIIPPSAR